MSILENLSGRCARTLCWCAVVIAFTIVLPPSAFSVEKTWKGTSANMNVAGNWDPSGVPTSSTTDLMKFDGSSAFTSPTFTGTIFSGGGNAGGLGGITVTFEQTADLSISKTDAGSVFRLAKDANVTIEAGAGAFSMGTTGSNFTLNIARNESGPVTQNSFINNSTNVATLGDRVTLNASSGTQGRANFAGSGDWLVSGKINPSINLGVFKNGTGTLTLTGANEYTSSTTINAGVLNIRSDTALGAALGNAATSTTVGSGAALELQGGIAVGNEALNLNGSGISNNGALRNNQRKQLLGRRHYAGGKHDHPVGLRYAYD